MRVKFAECNVLYPEDLDWPTFLELLEGFLMEGRDEEGRRELNDLLENTAAIEQDKKTEALKSVGVSDLALQMRKEMNAAKTTQEKLAVRKKYQDIARKAKAQQEANRG